MIKTITFLLILLSFSAFSGEKESAEYLNGKTKGQLREKYSDLKGELIEIEKRKEEIQQEIEIISLSKKICPGEKRIFVDGECLDLIENNFTGPWED